MAVIREPDVDEDIEIQELIQIDYEDEEIDLEDVDWDDYCDLVINDNDVQTTFKNESNLVVLSNDVDDETSMAMPKEEADTKESEKSGKTSKESDVKKTSKDKESVKVKILCPYCGKPYIEKAYYDKHIFKYHCMYSYVYLLEKPSLSQTSQFISVSSSYTGTTQFSLILQNAVFIYMLSFRNVNVFYLTAKKASFSEFGVFRKIDGKRS